MEEFFRELIGGFARVIVAALIVWMIFLIVLLFKELFSPGKLDFKEYLYRVWRMLLFSFEITAYGGLIVGPILMFKTERYLTYSLVFVVALLFSALAITIRRKVGDWGLPKIWSKER